jgi:hypothetical protein
MLLGRRIMTSRNYLNPIVLIILQTRNPEKIRCEADPCGSRIRIRNSTYFRSVFLVLNCYPTSFTDLNCFVSVLPSSIVLVSLSVAIMINT